MEADQTGLADAGVLVGEDPSLSLDLELCPSLVVVFGAHAGAGHGRLAGGGRVEVTPPDGAAFAIVMAITSPEAESRHHRASQIIVPADTPGYALERNISVMGQPGSDHASHGELRFDGCRVPVANLLGPEGEGFRIAQERLGPGRRRGLVRYGG